MSICVCEYIGSGGFGRVYVAPVDRLPLSALTQGVPSTAPRANASHGPPPPHRCSPAFDLAPCLVSTLPHCPLADLRCLEAVAIKRAKSGLSGGLLKFQDEVRLLKDCDHPHLLPLLGYCLSDDGRCLISPLKRGGSLGMRLQPASADMSQLALLGLSLPLKPLT